MLFLDYLSESAHARLTRSADLQDSSWNRLREAIFALESDARFSETVLTCDWTTLLEIAPLLAIIRREHAFDVSYSDAARSMLATYARERQAVLRTGPDSSFSLEDLASRLNDLGFERQDHQPLRDHQVSNIRKLVALPNGADFSVPGAGKTTVALAVHLLSTAPETKLLVVAPKNAFAAWDTVLDECLQPRERLKWHFTRLTGGATFIESLLALSPRCSIISYEQLVRVRDIVLRYMSRYPVHLVLDESHRIKAGYRAQRGAALISLAHLPVRRDILSGTPMPRSVDDLVAQIDFLWPGQSIGSKIRSAGSDLSNVIRPLFVRTTKAQLGLRKPRRHYISIRMSNPQVALYSLIRDEVLRRSRGIKTSGTVDLIAAKRSIVRLMQVSSNPILMVRSITGDRFSDFPHDNESIRAIFEAIVQEQDSPKLLAVCDKVRELANSNQKSVVWTSFTENVERIAEVLGDVKAVYIHGGVDSGDTEDIETREGRIKAFHDDPSIMTLVANPAACSEGISLHKVCHHALYLDRTFNAAHYLQSVDRIHRLGLDPDLETDIHIFESVTPTNSGSVDYSVRRRTSAKLREMSRALEDSDLTQLALDEEEADAPLDYDITIEDIRDLIDELEERGRTDFDDDF